MTTVTERRSWADRAASAWRADRRRIIVSTVLAVLLVVGFAGLDPGDWFVTIVRGLAVGAITFLVASGLSLILGLMDVLNLAHGELFMLGAYLGWTAYIRPDTTVDLLVPLLLTAVPFALWGLWRPPARAVAGLGRYAGWVVAALGLAGWWWAIRRFPLVIWNPDVFSEAPGTYSLAFDTGLLTPLPAGAFTGSALVAILVLVASAAVMAIGLASISGGGAPRVGRFGWFGAAGAAAVGLGLLVFRGPVVDALFAMNPTLRFFAAGLVAVAVVAALGAGIEVALIRPLYDRPIYQLMITLGLGFIIIELVRAVWGRPDFTMPKPPAFNGTGDGCPGQGIGDLFSGCSTIELFGSRIRTYNELFVVAVGIAVLVGVNLLLKRTRIGMIIRAGVQDRAMVEALGVNVRVVFMGVFALGAGLAALGGVLAGPSIGLSPEMGGRLLLSALIALAIGGLTSFPGAAVAAVLVGLIQQLVIRYGQIGIPLPGLEEPFKPSPPLVPASTVILMIVVLLVLPNGLLGKVDR